MFVNDALIGDHWAIFSMVLGMICSFYIMTKQSTELLMKATGANLLAWGIVIVSIIYIGLRPLWCYADTKLYTTVFNMVQSGEMTSLPFHIRSGSLLHWSIYIFSMRRPAIGC